MTLLIAYEGSCKNVEIPSSVRSQQAIKTVKPELIQALAAQGLHYGSPLFIRIFKQEKELEVWIANKKSFVLFRTYKICTYSGELGPKQREGDLQSPEGFYTVTPRQLNPNSQFHLSFNLGYPNVYDRVYGRTGSALMVHGNCVSIGCYAMTDAKIEEIYALADAALRQGQPAFQVHAFPFRMSQENMKLFEDSIWFEFWLNLKEGYDFFEETKRVPQVTVKNKKYKFK